MKANKEQKGKITRQCFLITKTHFIRNGLVERVSGDSNKIWKDYRKIYKTIWYKLTEEGYGLYKRANKKQPRDKEEIKQ